MTNINSKEINEDIDDVEINNSKFKTEDSQQTNLKSQVTSKIYFN